MNKELSLNDVAELCEYVMPKMKRQFPDMTEDDIVKLTISKLMESGYIK